MNTLPKRRARSRVSLSLGLLGGLGFFLAAQTVKGLDRNWTGGGADDNWSTAANWVTAPVTTGGDQLRFGGSVRTSNVNDFTNAIFSGIIFESGASAFTLGGNAIGLDNALNGIRNSSSVGQTINFGIALLDTSNSTTLQTTGGTVTINGVVSGAGGFTLSGANFANLNGANTFSGGIALSAGRALRLGHAQAAGTGALAMSGGTLAFAGGIHNFSAGGVSGSGTFALTDDLGAGVTLTLNGSADYSKTAAITGLGGLVVSLQPGGKQTLSGANTYTGGTTLNSGTLDLASASGNLAATGALTINGGSLLISRAAAKTVTVASLNGTGGEIVANTFSTTAQNATLVVNNSGNDRFDGNMKNGTGNLVLTKSGTGTLTLGGANSYTGATTVNAGLLNIDGSLTASNVTVGANGALGGNGGVISQSVTINDGGAMSFTLESPLETNLIVGSLSLGSDIDLQLALAGAVGAGQSFTILDIGGSYTGTFATVNGQAFGADNAFSLQYGSQWYDFELSYGPNAVVLSVVPEPRAVLWVALAGGCLLLGRKGTKGRKARLG